MNKEIKVQIKNESNGKYSLIIPLSSETFESETFVPGITADLIERTPFKDLFDLFVQDLKKKYADCESVTIFNSKLRDMFHNFAILNNGDPRQSTRFLLNFSNLGISKNVVIRTERAKIILVGKL